MAKTLDEVHYNNIFSNNVNFKQRIIYFNDDVDEWSLSLFEKALDELEKEEKPITIEVSTYGGYVDEMFGIVDRIRSSSCQIITRGFGKIMSAGTFIVAAGDEGQRYAGELTQFMVHELSAEIEGTLRQLKNELKALERSQEQMYNLYEELSLGKTSINVWKKIGGRNLDCYLTAKDALELGLIDHIVNKRR